MKVHGAIYKQKGPANRDKRITENIKLLQSLHPSPIKLGSPVRVQ